MLPQHHFLIGSISSIFIYLNFPEISILNIIIFLLASVLIDVDHYLYYVYRKKDWNLKNAINWFMRNGKALKKLDIKKRAEFYTGFCFLHGIEVLILLAILGYFINNIFSFIALGFLVHLILDYIHQANYKGRFDKFSIIYDYFKYGDLKFVEEIESLTRLKS